MKLVSLDLPHTEDSCVSLVIAGDFEPEELRILEQFGKLMNRLRTCNLLTRGMGGFCGLTFDMNGISIRSAPCTDGELFELLHVMRPVTLEDERASFKNVTTILGRRLRSEELLQFIKVNKRIFRDGEMSLYMQVSVGSHKLFAESLLNVWLNGTQYHTDDDKARTWNELEASLGDSSARALVLTQLHSKVKALMNVDYVAHKVLLAPLNDV
ncbi:hypothetical protein LOC51_37265 [Rubrivivax sp. JA1024]|nr:hypothetical protein [Rubrivivax sp. JA1024]